MIISNHKCAFETGGFMILEVLGPFSNSGRLVQKVRACLRIFDDEDYRLASIPWPAVGWCTSGKWCRRLWQGRCKQRNWITPEPPVLPQNIHYSYLFYMFDSHRLYFSIGCIDICHHVGLKRNYLRKWLVNIYTSARASVWLFMVVNKKKVFSPQKSAIVVCTEDA